MTIHSVVIQKLLSTNAHLGRHITSHHIKPFIHGTRNHLSIFDSDKTLISLRTALDFITHLLRNNHHSRFLFVNTNPLFDHIFDHMTRKTGHASFLSPQSQYWRLGGFLTNPSSPKKFRSRNKKICFAPAQPPDCVVIVDFERKSSVVNEAARLQIPVIGLVDSSVPREVFEKITYPIPCNDSVQFVYTVCNLITKTFLLEKKGLNLNVVDDSSHSPSEEEAMVKKDNQSAENNQSAEETKVVDANCFSREEEAMLTKDDQSAKDIQSAVIS